MSKIVIQAGQAFVLGVLGIGVQQLVTAGIYGVLAYPFGSPLRVSWLDYVQEYLLWRARLPGHAMTQTQIVANSLGLVVVVVGGLLVYEGAIA